MQPRHDNRVGCIVNCNCISSKVLDEEYNDTDRLIERFRESMSLPLTDRYFDEDELIDIFDTAGDTADDLLRMEVLSVASRFHPDSNELNQRRCLFYNQISEAAGREYIESTGPKEGQMWDVLRMRNMLSRSDADFGKEFDSFLASVRKFDEDEVAIQFIRLVADANLPDWLLNNVEGIKSRSSNKKMILFETATAFETMNCNEEAARLLTELTEIDPFGYSNWLMLAEQYLAIGNFDEFNNAIDYALAINPDDWQGIYVKAKYYFNKGDFNEAKTLFGQCCALSPTMYDPYRLYAFTLQRCGDEVSGISILRSAMEKFPAEILNIIPDLILLRPADIGNQLDTYFRFSADNDESVWHSWVTHLWESGFHDIAVEVAECYLRNTGQYLVTLIVAEYYFRHDIKHLETLSWIKNYASRSIELSLPTDPILIYIINTITLARLGYFLMAEENLRWLKRYTEIELPTYSINRRLAQKQCESVVQKIEEKLSGTPRCEDFKDLSQFGL